MILRNSSLNLEVTKLFHDCCMFDLKQTLTDNAENFQISMLDNECFSSLTNSIGTTKTSGIEQEQFNQWICTKFPTLFNGFEIWLHKRSAMTKNNREETASVYCPIKIIILCFCSTIESFLGDYEQSS